MNHEAIYRCYPSVRTISDGSGPVDDEGKKVFIDEALVAKVSVEVELEKAWKYTRAKRDALLSQSDWTQLSDSSANKTAWASYRQTLRDIPQDFSKPEDVVWPTKPE